ncbi:hypothetical protein GCM10011387_32450 [Pedobacter quisquiliarum]|jgi:cellulose biosynthesis protein BcsQ|uniref:AAA domain-containing protein n=1 Tax=Pedobacter quisquiliarum TaxID=1834438 RepID=A0A916XIN7_9SPHI|nr:AAA family ATPase [Pedobacter quisquiliarum]GGC76167.1 hypothetical protein GCM10011387_32450 [Pedobacter quisquiliarum]
MIQIYTGIERLEKSLIELQKANEIIDFRIYLKSNNTITIYIIGPEHLLDKITKIWPDTKLEVEFFLEEDEDNFLKNLYFNEGDKVNTTDSDRRLVNLLAKERLIDTGRKSETPIITFYSYKGGVGRSTTLASCAAYLATHHSKKVVIIDCDFEAPGFTNFFLTDSGAPFYSNGVVEYLLDSDLDNSELSIRNYLWEASKEYSGKGEIFVMPSGNLNDFQTEDVQASDRDHYLKGLARIDFSERQFIVNKFNSLIYKINEEIKPDLILLDSRTGFNDVFGLTAFQLSDIVIGFFGNNIQTLPGIHFFIDSIIKRQYLVGIIVNSIIPASNKRRWFNNFKENVQSYLSRKSLAVSNGVIINDDEINIDMFPITRNEVLESVGNKDSDRLDFIDLIKEKSSPEQAELFEKINSLLYDYNKYAIKESENSEHNEEDLYIEDTDHENIEENFNELSELNKIDSEYEIFDAQNDNVYEVKMRVLTTLKEKMPELYAEDIEDFQLEYNQGRYFYRNCMLDLFNLDKFIVLGNKGTGKTYIYKSLKNNDIVSHLKGIANKSEIEYRFIHIIFKNKYFIDTTKFDGLEKYSNEKYYERFWQVYIWNVLTRELDKELSLTSTIETFPVEDNTITSLRFNQIISSDDMMIEVELGLENIDRSLKIKGDEHVIIIFDELDHVVKPHLWSERVAPLINLCKKFTYSRIFPKMFLRSDLFEKISNVNNIQALNNRSINIEWNREELFAYFFKIILSHSKDDFYFLMREYKDFPKNHIAKIRREIDKQDKQPATEEYILKHLTATFFGKYADVNNTPRYGESYDWFFKNLKNANETISLRPFIDLLSESVKWAIIGEDRRPKPILPQYYYTHGQTRGKAVERHFKDLASEKGNGDLTYIFQYIRDDADSRFKLLELQQQDFYNLLDNVIEKYSSALENKTKEGLIELLKVNGIILDRFQRAGATNNVQKRYQFALLYKYYLGLKNKIRN